MSTEPLPTIGFVRQHQLIGPGKPLPISKTTLWRYVAQGKIASPIRISPGITAWRVEDVRAFIAAAGGH